LADLKSFLVHFIRDQHGQSDEAAGRTMVMELVLTNWISLR